MSGLNLNINLRKKGEADHGHVYNKILKHLTSECLYLYLRGTMISKLICSLHLSLAIIRSIFFEDYINEYCACPKLYYHSLNV